MAATYFSHLASGGRGVVGHTTKPCAGAWTVGHIGALPFRGLGRWCSGRQVLGVRSEVSQAVTNGRRLRWVTPFSHLIQSLRSTLWYRC